MQTLVMILGVLLVLFLVLGGVRAVSAPKCPPGYVQSPVQSTWAGWNFECVPVGLEAALIPSNTLTRPMTTIYAPIIAGTGPAPKCGAPAKILEFVEQR